MTAEECSDLHIWTDGQTCISLWRPSLLERLSILLFGRIWLFVRSGPTQPPATLDAHRAIFQEEPAHAQ